MPKYRRNLGTAEREVIYAVMSVVQDPEFRDIAAMVCKEWKTIESETRQHVNIDLCYKCTPEMLVQRYPCIQSLTLKGKPRGAKYTLPAQEGNHYIELIPEDWGGSVTSWLQCFSTNDPESNDKRMRNLKSLHLKRMYVTDQDLKCLTISHGSILEVLKLENCSGFSTDGLLDIVTSSKRNLKTLFLKSSFILEKETRRAWLQALSSNRVLENVVFFNTNLRKVNHGDLEDLIHKCPNLTTLKTSFVDINKLGTLFNSARKLKEFWSSQRAAGGEQIMYAPPKLPEQLCSLGIGDITGEAMKLLVNGSSTASKLTELNLLIGLFSRSSCCDLIRLCPNLRVLLASNVIGDDGLVEVGKCCPRLRRVRIEAAISDHEERSRITEIGLLALAVGCKQLEKLAVYTHSITSETLSGFGTHCRNLCDFRIAMVEVEGEAQIQDEIILDNGVADLLRGCEKLQRFALGLNQVEGFLLTEVGIEYIGLYGTKLKWMLLNGVGDIRIQEPVNLFVRPSCPNLKKIELVNCNISPASLAQAVLNLPDLTSLIVQDSDINIRNLLAHTNAIQQMSRPYWNVEYNSPTDGSPDGVAHIHGYYSLVAESRTDFPANGSVVPISLLAL